MKFSDRVPGPCHEVYSQSIVTRDWLDLVGLMMVMLGKSFLPRGSLDLLHFHTIKAVCDATLLCTELKLVLGNFLWHYKRELWHLDITL